MPKPLKILKASAGSGKTFSLAAHYLTLLFGGAKKHREILAVTFTNKATEEMKTRILEVLEALAKGEESAKPYADIILKAHPQLSIQELKQKADEIYRNLLHDYSRFSVSTIDGFVQKVIRGFAFELNLASGYGLEMNYDKVKNELASRLEQKLDEHDNLLQWIIELALDRINNNKNWNYKRELLELSSEVFKNNFQDFEQSVAQFGDDSDTLFKTYIAITKEIIGTFEDTLKTQGQKAVDIFSQYDIDKADLVRGSVNWLFKLFYLPNLAYDKFDKIFELIDNPEIWFKPNKDNPALYADLNPLLAEIQIFYQTNRKDYELARAFYKNAYFLRLMQEIASILKDYRAESETLLISDAQKLLNGIAEDSGENPSFIWEKMGNIYKNFLFDEFQDTSKDQWNSFKALVMNAMSTHDGLQHDHLVVGDTKQSIYRWRDGDYNLLHQQVKLDVGIANVQEESLQDNRRSTAEIIGFNNQLYAALPEVLQDNIDALLPKDDVAVNEMWLHPSNKFDTILKDIYKDVAQSTHDKTRAGGKVVVKKIAIDADENKKDAALREMLVQIAVLIDEKEYFQREIGVLVRTNTEAAQVVAALMADGRDVISGEALKIANNTAVKLIVNVLHLLNVTPKYAALYKANCIALYAKIQGKSTNADDFLGLNNTPIAQLGSILPPAFCENYQEWLPLPVPEIIERIIAEFIVRKDETANPHLPYLLAFRDLAGKVSLQGEKGISAFLSWWEEEGQNKNLPSPETANAIQVMTIHKSKGLAFRAVLVPFCNWEVKGRTNVNFWVAVADTPYKALGSVPLSYNSSLANSAVAKHYLAEVLYNHLDALNTLYVATTRAVDFLYLGIPEKQSGNLTNIGDAVLKALEKANGAMECGHYLNEHQNSKPIQPIQLKDYPVSKRLLEIYEPIEDRPLRYLDNLETSGKRGEVLHRILSEINTTDEIEPALAKVALEGLIKTEETAEYAAALHKVLSNAALKQLLTGGVIQLNEKAIITSDGKTKRPDKIIINGKEVTIVDYKFTFQREDKHRQQLLEYKQLLLNMGYEKADAYLYYEENDKLISVQ